MMRLLLMVILMHAAAVLALAADTAPKKPTYDPPPGKSMFLRDRLRRPIRVFNDGGFRPPPARPLPVFVGAVEEEDTLVAFLLDVESDQVTHVRVGDTLLRGVGIVRAITLDHMDIGSASSAAIRRIDIGQNLVAAPAAAANPAPGGSSTTTAPSGTDAAGTTTAPAGDAAIPAADSTAPTADPTDTDTAVPPDAGTPAGTPVAAPTTNPADDLIERMRKRRLQELGK